MGLYKFTNQYLNKVIPDADQDFKKTWIQYRPAPEENFLTFAFVDPAISLEDNADYTATCVIHVDEHKNWYLDMAYRQRITVTDTVNWLFRLADRYNLAGLGVEDVAYQKAILQIMSQEMQKRNKMLPLKGIKRSTMGADGIKRDSSSKKFRIRSLVPRFEFGQIFLTRELDEFLIEYSSFPRGAHDDLLDALASMEEIVYYPDPKKENKNVTNPNHPDYESHFIRRLASGQNRQDDY